MWPLFDREHAMDNWLIDGPQLKQRFRYVWHRLARTLGQNNSGGIATDDQFFVTPSGRLYSWGEDGFSVCNPTNAAFDRLPVGHDQEYWEETGFYDVVSSVDPRTDPRLDDLIQR